VTSVNPQPPLGKLWSRGKGLKADVRQLQWFRSAIAVEANGYAILAGLGSIEPVSAERGPLIKVKAL